MWNGGGGGGAGGVKDGVGPPMAGRIVLVEPNLDLDNGHWGDSIAVLARAAVARGFEVVVIGPRPPSPSLSRSLAEMGVVVPDAARFGLVARCLGNLGSWLGVMEARRRARGDLERAGDLWLARVLIDEVVSLRAARRVRTAVDGVVLLTGSGSFIGLSTVLSQCAHVRVVHEVYRPAAGWAATAAGLRLGARSRVRIVCPTQGVADTLLDSWRGDEIEVRPFAVRDHMMYRTSEQRVDERGRFGVDVDSFVIAVVGGWWPAKDVTTILEALEMVGPGACVILAGHPMDQGALTGLMETLGDQLIVIDRPLNRDDLEAIYAIADVSVVSRYPGVVKESGLVLDALRYGVHLIVSDHDPSSQTRLSELEYVSLFQAGDPLDLANTITRTRKAGAMRPGPSAAEDFGLLSADESLEAYWSSRPASPIGRLRKARTRGDAVEGGQ